LKIKGINETKIRKYAENIKRKIKKKKCKKGIV